ncbi:MAG: hypothetical protein K0U68_11830, partial [Gammaproteobacteria bacterium]|nr:hypothetical protein [Gammaproteobacteria bacterium]
IFGDNFDPSSVSRENWGDVTITFDSCDTASMQYESNDGTESGTLNLSRLTNLDGLKCELPANASTQALPSEAAKKSGTFFDPTHDGEGAVIQILENNSAVVYWYTYDQSGNQVWILGTGTFDGTTITVDNAITATGGILANFNPNDVVRETWGNFTITYSSCTEATLQYNSSVSGFGSGQQNLERLTTPKGLEC